MTQQPYYPPQPGQQGPPPGWGQQAPQYPPQAPAYPDPNQQGQYPPAGAPQGPPQGQAPTPFNQAAPSGPPAGGDAWDNPDAPTGGGGDAPNFHQLEGRLCFFKPTTSTPDSPINAKYIKRDPATQQPIGPTTEHLVITEVLVLDGEPIVGAKDGNTGVTTPFSGGPRQIPTYFKQVYVRGAVVPGQLARKVGGGLVLGRVVRGTPSGNGRPPLVVNNPTEQDNIVARSIFPMWDQLVAQAAGQMGPPVQGGQVVPPPGYVQAPGQPYPGQPYPPQQAAPQGPPPGQYPQQPAGPPPGWGQQVQQPAPPQSWPQQGYPGPTH